MAERAQETKQDVLDSIAHLLDVPPWEVGPGSTEPKRMFTDVIERLRLAIGIRQGKPALGRAISAAAGLDWGRAEDSTHTPSGGGDTVTLAGLQRVREAVQLLLGGPRLPGRPPGVRGRAYIAEAPSTTTTVAVYERDPERYDRSSNAHKTLQGRLADLLRGRGIEPLSWNPEAGDPPFDIGWRAGPAFHCCEVKSATEENRVAQVRMGLGQLLEYGARLDALGEPSVVLALALELPVLPMQRRACERGGIRFLAGPTLEHDLVSLVEG
jgi:hypothetical protein